MEEETKQAFSNIAKGYDGKVILAYYEKKLAELNNVQNATKENFEGRKFAGEFIEKEIVNKLKVYRDRVLE